VAVYSMTEVTSRIFVWCLYSALYLCWLWADWCR